MIPVIDIFAGPGGLGEGFSAYRQDSGSNPFKIALSVEMDENARETLKLRSFFRQFRSGEAPAEYFRVLAGTLLIGDLYANRTFQAETKAADDEAMRAQLGNDDSKIHREVVSALAHHRIDLRCAPENRPHWILIGGPPCQAYSLVGRSRMRPANPRKYASDPRHELYQHYLKIIAKYEPSVFVMENVKGILSSKLRGERIFTKILRDLSVPGRSTGEPQSRRNCSEYEIFPCVDYGGQGALFGGNRGASTEPADYVVRCELHGIPQRRHRVILIGVRRDLNCAPDPLPYRDGEGEFISVESAIKDLPKLRSELSSKNGWPSWADAVRASLSDRVLREVDPRTAAEMGKWAEKLLSGRSTGGEHCKMVMSKRSSWLQGLADWFSYERVPAACNHATRTHIGEDLQRYFYAACFANVHSRSPKLSDFPRALWPEHKNVTEQDPDDFIFEDRFRVQLRDFPATTVTSHISKDGHYFIHYDPTQCRSLTVREAARLQTFPDTYFFAGPRTTQYQQVGNAVPPLLAYQIAKQVHNMLSR